MLAILLLKILSLYCLNDKNLTKVSTLEERDELKKVRVDELHGIITTYEMRTGQDKNSKKEAVFKFTSKNQSKNLDDEEALFVSRLDKRTGK